MEYQVGDIMVGQVTGVQPYGAFIRFPNEECGLIHISEISSYFVRNVSDYVKVGQHVRVKIIDIYVEKNMYRLSLKQVAERRRQNIRKMNNDVQPLRKKRVTISKVDFAPLQAKLPEWINIELKKMEEENG